MVNYSGGHTYILVDKESTYNTPVSPTKDLGIIGTVDTDMNNNTIEVNSVGGREVSDLLAGNFDSSISMDGNLNSGAIFELFFGQATDTETTGDYTHTFIDDDGSETMLNDISSFTLSSNFNSSSDVQYTFGGCVVNSVDVTVNVGEAATISSEVFAADVDTDTTVGTQVTTSTTPFNFAQCTLSLGDEGSESSLNQVTAFNLNMTNNFDLADIRGLGSRVAQGAVPKNFQVSGEFTVKFQDKTLADRFLGGSSASSSTPTDSGLIFQATNGVTLGSGRIEFYVRLYGVQLESLGQSVASDGVVEETFSFRGTTVKDCYFVDAVSTYF